MIIQKCATVLYDDLDQFLQQKFFQECLKNRLKWMASGAAFLTIFNRLPSISNDFLTFLKKFIGPDYCKHL